MAGRSSRKNSGNANSNPAIGVQKKDKDKEKQMASWKEITDVPDSDEIFSLDSMMKVHKNIEDKFEILNKQTFTGDENLSSKVKDMEERLQK